MPTRNTSFLLLRFLPGEGNLINETPLPNLPLSLPLKNTGRGCFASSPFLLWTYPCLQRAELGSINSAVAESPRRGRKKTDQGPRMSLSSQSHKAMFSPYRGYLHLPLLVSYLAQKIKVGLFIWLLRCISNQYLCIFHKFKIN